MTEFRRIRPVLPDALAERARRFARGGVAEVPPRAAATVVLMRDGSAGLEVYMLRRSRSMAFAGGMYAFPGGAVDAQDGDAVGAAIRELFEEAGVLLAGPSDDSIVADVTGPEWETDRRRLVAREVSFADLLRRRGLVPRTDLLALWAHWITPRFEERRYDTQFFLALLPEGQRAQDVSGEADDVGWFRPADALSATDRGEIAMLPPTVVTLAELSEYESANAAFTACAGRTVVAVTPQAVVDGDVVRLVLPGDPEWSE